MSDRWVQRPAWGSTTSSAVAQRAIGARLYFACARRQGDVLNASPEFEDCVRVAEESGRPVKDVQAAAMKAFLDQSPTRRA